LAKPTIASTVPTADVRSPRRERFELRIDLRGELGHELQLPAAPSFPSSGWLDLLLQHGDVLHQQRVQRPRVEKQYAPFERRRRALEPARGCRGPRRTT
jgi:hypothetical protein